ncbi:hypothetical protein [Streptomyces sp. G-G2]|uniref:hypothetical protein n=1 Tax=Streptomyces sp. G-G2 TaxID=3046201 RepID=UPI0024BB3F3E|nr:hypothetical protein [Streptomyces sp. G-G2]MDJ0386181.1 hypothetical protein [Streptomyces sp. G-G2]
MTLQLNPADIGSVLLADGWHTVRNFNTGASPFGDGTIWFSFTDTLEGGVEDSLLAGPVSAIQSVAVPKSHQPQQSQAEEIARQVKGRVEDDTVIFEFGTVEFELWLGSGGWSLARRGDRDNARAYGYGKDDRAGTVASAVMGDLKTGDLPGQDRSDSSTP